MSVPGPSARFVYYFDPTADLGVDLTATNGQVGAFTPPGFNETLQDLTGSASTTVAVLPVGHVTSDDFTLPIWADDGLQEMIDDVHGVTTADRRDARLLVIGWMGGDVAGQLADCAEAYLKNVKPLTPQALLTQLETVWGINGAVRPSTILHALAEETADGDTESTSEDNGASSSDGGWGCWGYTALDLDSGDAFVPRVIDSTDDMTYGALITFTGVTATTGGGQVPTFVSGTVERYVACDWDFTGTPGGSETCTFFIAFQRL